MSPDNDGTNRGLSPVVGTVLLVGIVVLLVGVTTAVLFGATESEQPAPTTRIDVEATDQPGQFELLYRAGDTLDGDRVTVRGVEDPAVLAGERLVAGETVVVTPTQETLRVVWTEDAADPVSYTLHRFELDPGTVGTRFDGTVFTGSASGIKTVDSDGGSVTTIPGTGTVEALGPATADLTGDGKVDLPYVDSSGQIHAVDGDGSGGILAASADITGSVATSKTRLGVGSWNGSDQSVFFVDQNNDHIYRVAPGGSPAKVASPGDGAQAVVGVGEVDGDGDDELLFADASQTLQYLEPDGSVVTTGVSLGSSSGIGSGSMADFDDDGRVEVAAVDGGNNVQMVGASGGDTVTSGDVAGTSAPQAEKSSASASDVDGDGEAELVYVGHSSGHLEYLDGVGSGTIQTETLRDSAGNPVAGSAGTGVT